MDARERLARYLDLDYAGVEAIVKKLGQSVLGDRLAAAPAQTHPLSLFQEVVEVGCSGGIHLKQVPDQRRGLWIGLFGFAAANVQVSQWCRHGQDTLLQPTIESLLRLFLEVSDEIGGDYGLDVGGETAAAGVEVQTLIGEMDVDSAVDHLAEVRPIPEIARAPINLVDDHTKIG